MVIDANSKLSKVNFEELQEALKADVNFRRRLIKVLARDHAEDYLVLPVIVRIEWSGRLGARSFEMSTMFADLRKESDEP